MNESYLEISGRASGKTFRLVTKINQYLLSKLDGRVYLFTSSARNTKEILDQFTPHARQRIINVNRSKDVWDWASQLQDINFGDCLAFDNFDQQELTVEILRTLFSTKLTTIAVTTPAKLRHVGADPEKDALLYLVKHFGGRYTSVARELALSSDFADQKKISQEFFKQTPELIRATEFFGNLYSHKENPRDKYVRETADKLLAFEKDLSQKLDNFLKEVEHLKITREMTFVTPAFPPASEAVTNSKLSLIKKITEAAKQGELKVSIPGVIPKDWLKELEDLGYHCYYGESHDKSYIYWRKKL